MGASDFLTSFKSKVSYKLDSFLPYLANKKELIEKVKKLEEKSERNTVDLLDKQSLEQENAALRELLRLPVRPELTLIYARIISRDPVSWHRKFRINKGQEHGLSIGQAVLSEGYLLGRIKKTDRFSSEIITIINKNCKVSVKVEDKIISGILQGFENKNYHQNAECIIKYLPRDYSFKVGDIFYTSGFGSVIPAGIPVGMVIPSDKREKQISQVVNHSYKNTKISPFIDFNNLKFVTVLSGNN
ncbi:MAG: rod shape-determining protein MreC [Verrucomicrobiota bacterium]|nr:rod shape-determining protein MreC [Verrucomicrobiota bacterium]